MWGRRNRGGSSAPPGERPAPLGSTSSAYATWEEELLKNVPNETEEKTRASHCAEAGQASSSSAMPSPSRFWRGAPMAAKKVLSLGKNYSLSSPKSPARNLHEQKKLSPKSESMHVLPACNGIDDETAADAQDEAAFAEMEQAMTGLLDLSHKKVERPKSPRDSATKWPSRDTDPLHGGAMDDPVILASRYYVDQSEEQIQGILEKFAGHSGLQREALHFIHLMSKTSKGVQPCLKKWPDLIPVLIDLKEKWQSVWTGDLDEERLAIILNLSMHRSNREILAGHNKLPAVLKKVVDKADMLGRSASLFAMVASTIAILSESDVFRKRVLDIGGMEMLRDLLKIEDIAVRKEAGSAILALCTDEEANSSAADYDVPNTLLECFMVTDEFLLLLDRLPKTPHVLDKICDQAVEFVNIIMEEHASEIVTCQALYSTISLIDIIVQRDAHKINSVTNVEKLKERLQKLSSTGTPTYTQLKVENIVSTLTEMFPSRTMMNWSDAKVRKLRPLRLQERTHASLFFQDLCSSMLLGCRQPNPPYKMALQELQSTCITAEGKFGRGELPAPPMFVCRLSGEIMSDPVTISSGETFNRASVELWFQKEGHVCLITGGLVSHVVLPNERLKGYFKEWDDAVRAIKARLRMKR